MKPFITNLLLGASTIALPWHAATAHPGNHVHGASTHTIGSGFWVEGTALVVTVFALYAGARWLQQKLLRRNPSDGSRR